MTDQLSASTATTSTGEHPVYQPQEATRTYTTPELGPPDTPREPPATSADFVVLTTAPTTAYIQTSINVTVQALRRTMAALNEELRRRI